MSNKLSNKFLTCTVDRFENYQAVLSLELSSHHKQELIIAKRYLPRGCKEGDILHLEFTSEQKAQKERKNLAYNILEEILKGDAHGSQERKTSTRIK